MYNVTVGFSTSSPGSLRLQHWQELHPAEQRGDRDLAQRLLKAEEPKPDLMLIW